jgi:type I restriction enzyme S subunit
MFAGRTAVPLLGHRLDPGFYDPRYVADERVLSTGRRDSLESLRSSSAKISYGVLKAVFAPSRTAMVRIQDFDDPFVDLSRSATIEPGHEVGFSRARCQPGDILLAIGGYPGRLGLVGAIPHDIDVVNVNQHIVRIRLREDTPTNYFVAAFLMTQYGYRLLARQVSGSVQAGVNVEDLRDVQISRFDAVAETYIGSKVRQAETLREWAAASELSFRKAVSVDVGHATTPARQFRVPSEDLDLDLNPGRFTPDRLEVRRRLSRGGGRILGSFVTIAAETVQRPAQNAWYLGLDGIATSSVDISLQRFADTGVSGACRVLPRGAAISKLRPYLNKAVFVPGGFGPVVGSTELLCVQSGLVHPGYLYGVLKLETTLRQLNPVASGSTHPRVGVSEVLDVVVPWSDEHERLGRSLERAQMAYFAARALVSSARLLVEALIERKVTETELIAASKSADADRTLLERLKEDGLDGTGTPLFPDLNSLADLLTEATQPSGDRS